MSEDAKADVVTLPGSRLFEVVSHEGVVLHHVRADSLMMDRKTGALFFVTNNQLSGAFFEVAGAAEVNQPKPTVH